jgi:hypothetical protein
LSAGWGANRNTFRESFKRLRRGRPFVLLSLFCFALVCVVVAIGRGGLLACANIAVTCCVAYLLNFFLLRHAGFAALVTAAPAPGVLAFLAVWRAQEIAAACAFALGLVVSILSGEAIAASVIENGVSGRFVAKIERGSDCYIAAVLTVLVVPLLVLGCVATGPWLEIAAAALLTAASTVVVMRLGTPLLDDSEDYIARANRARETFGRLFLPILAVARPRFGFSVFGIACVVTAIATFEMRPLWVASTINSWTAGSFAAVAMAASYSVLRDWRRSLAIVLSMLPPLLIGLWVISRSRAPATSATGSTLFIVASIIFSLQLFVARAASRGLQTEDDVIAGSERAIETKSMAVCIAGVITVASTLTVGWGAWFVCCVVVVAGAISAVLFQPAIAITIESLAPRAATVAARYRIK